MSTNDVRGLAEVIKTEVSALSSKARNTGDKLRHEIDQAHATIDHVDKMTDELHQATAGLQALLGLSTNGPPLADDHE